MRFGGRLHRKNSIWLHEGKAPRRHQASFLSGGFQKAKAAQGQIAADRSLLAHACGFGEAADAYFGTLRNKNRTDKSFSHSRPSHRQTQTDHFSDFGDEKHIVVCGRLLRKMATNLSAQTAEAFASRSQNRCVSENQWDFGLGFTCCCVGLRDSPVQGSLRQGSQYLGA